MITAKIQPSITFPNMRGDVTITWTEDSKEFIRELIEKKMAEGYQFFVVMPRKIFGKEMLKVKTKVTMKNVEDVMDKTSTATMKEDKDSRTRLNLELPNSSKEELSFKNNTFEIKADVDDKDISLGISKGKLSLARTEQVDTLKTVKRATNADELMDQQSVAVRPVFGG